MPLSSIFFISLQNDYEQQKVKMKANKVLFITQEITPYVPESEMANMGRFLPQAIQEKGREIRDRKSTRLNSSHSGESRMPSSA